jgi:hypothetical protein
MADKKQTRERIALGVLLAVAILVWFFYARSNAAVSGYSSGSGPYTPINAQDFGVVLIGLEKAQSTEYKSNGRNIFVAGAVPVETAAAGLAKPVNPPFHISGPHPDPPPTPPTLPPSMKFYGYGTEPAHGDRCAFLLEGEDLHIFKEGDSFAGHLRITKIGNDRLEFEDTNTGLHGSATLEMPAPAAS